MGSKCTRGTGLISCGLGSLERRLSNCGTGALVALSMWIFPGPGIKPVSLALAGGFLTARSQGKPADLILNVASVCILLALDLCGRHITKVAEFLEF